MALLRPRDPLLLAIHTWLRGAEVAAKRLHRAVQLLAPLAFAPGFPGVEHAIDVALQCGGNNAAIPDECRDRRAQGFQDLHGLRRTGWLNEAAARAEPEITFARPVQDPGQLGRELR